VVESEESQDDQSSDEDSDASSDINPDFIPDQCLFCGTLSGTFEQSIQHMSQAHAFSIPQRDSLIVDEETLIWYLHLVIFGYQECLLCGKTKHSVEGIQQHMMAKAHCRFEIDDAINDFYEFSIPTQRPEDLLVNGESIMRLPSGKILGQRASPADNASRRTAAQAESRDSAQSTEVIAGGGSELATRNERALARTATQLSQFRAGDQQSLAHLPAYELRSVIASRAKQLSSAKRAERRMRSRLEAKANKTSMKHFKPDVPGRLNG
jgi:pre-60S factor REI1